MADGVFFFGRHLSRGAALLDHVKQGVITKPILALWAESDSALDGGLSSGDNLALVSQAHGTNKPGGAPLVGNVFKLVQELGIIAVIVGVWPGVAGREDAGPTIKGIYQQTGIIGEGPQPAKGCVVKSLDVRVLGKGYPGFDGRGQGLEVRQTEKLKMQLGQFGADLP